MPPTPSVNFVQRRLAEWATNHDLKPSQLDSKQLDRAQAELGFDRALIDKARAKLIATSNQATDDAGSRFSSYSDGHNPQSAGRTGPQLMSGPLGVQFGGASTFDGNLDQIQQRFDGIAAKLIHHPERIDQLDNDFQSILDDLNPFIADEQQKKVGVDAQLAKKEERLNWFQKNIGIFSPADVRALRKQRDQLADTIGEARAFRGGARLAMRTGAEANAEMDPSGWQTRIDAKVAAVPTGSTADPARVDGVAALVKDQSRLMHVADEAHLDQQSLDTDLSDFKGEVKWHQRWKWVDVVIGGESGRGNLFRQAKSMNREALELVSDLESVEAHGERHTMSALNELLKLESAEYRGMRAQYDLLEPAYTGTKNALHSATEAQDALESAEHWIDRRDFLAATEPTEYEWVEETDYNGETKRVQKETSQHQHWESQYSYARNQAMWESDRAEREVRDVNGALPRLETALEKLGDNRYFNDVDDDINLFWGGFTTSFGMWSYESSRVDDIQRQLGRLEGQLHEIKGRLQPEYNRHHDYVFSAIAERRQELLTA